MPLKTLLRTHEGRVALVTGAGQGIGQAIALALAERGAQVIATDLKPPHETVGQIGSTACALELDVSQEEQWRSAAVAENVRYEPGLPLFEREVLPANNEKEEVGPLRRHIVEYGGIGHSRHEPLHRYKDGHYRVHERVGE